MVTDERPAGNRPAVIGFVAPSGTGKTTLLVEVIQRLVHDGFDIGAVKHDSHRIELDTEGKDSWRMRQAGAAALLVGMNQIAWLSDSDRAPALEVLIDTFFSDRDVVLVEGFRSAGIDTIVVHDDRDDRNWEPSPANVVGELHRDDIDGAVKLVKMLVGGTAATAIPSGGPNQ